MAATARTNTGRSAEFADNGGGGGGGSITRLQSKAVGGSFAIPDDGSWAVATDTSIVFTLTGDLEVEIYGAATAAPGTGNILDAQLGIRVVKTAGATTDYPGIFNGVAAAGAAFGPVTAQEKPTLTAGEYTVSLIARSPTPHSGQSLESSAARPTRLYIEYGTGGGGGSGDIKADGTVPFSANESMGGNNLTDVADPVNPQDADTQAARDAAIAAAAITPTYVFTSPGELTTTDNDLIPWIPGRGYDVAGAKAIVKAAPTGDDLEIDIVLIDTSDGTVISVIDTVVIAAGDFEGTVTFSSPVNIPTSQALAVQITQIGSADPGENLTVAVH